MNQARRKRLSAALDRLAVAKQEIEEIRDEEQEAYDNLPESFQSGERGDAMQVTIDCLQSACDELENIESGDVRAIAEDAA